VVTPPKTKPSAKASKPNKWGWPPPEGVVSGDPVYGYFPQRGSPQEVFARADEDLVIYGGAAGGGKTLAMILDFARHHDNPWYRGVIFRRLTTHITNEGGLWQWATEVYGRLGGRPNQNLMTITFKSGARIAFKHLQYESTKYSHQGMQAARIGFDELTHFTESQFWYLFSRLRTTCHEKTGVRATCNPDAESWVAKFLEWWIDPNTGFMIPERCDRTRWLVRLDDQNYWFDSEQAAAASPEGRAIKAKGGRAQSVRFVPSKLTDNQALMAADPDYASKLLLQNSVDAARLLEGNWKVVAEEGEFKREWFAGRVVDAVRFDRGTIKRVVRAWDLASTPKKPTNDPDFTAGVLVGLDAQNRAVVLDVVRGRWDAADVEAVIGSTADADRQVWGNKLATVIEVEGGSSGKAWVQSLIRNLGRHAIQGIKATDNKVARAKPFAAQSKAGNVMLVGGHWTTDWLNEVCRFPYGRHDDQVDATSYAYARVIQGGGWSLDDYRQAGAV
jgi:predicted phage terminase large subunit-like protein